MSQQQGKGKRQLGTKCLVEVGDVQTIDITGITGVVGLLGLDCGMKDLKRLLGR